MRRLAILGASGHGKVVADTAMQTGKWDDISFFDDAWSECQKNGQWQVIGDTNKLQQSLSSFQGVIIAIGNNQIREQKQKLLTLENAPLITLIHPTAYVSPSAKMGIGSVVFANTVINIDASIGEGCIINTGSTVDHDCQLANYCHISPGAHLAGEVSIGDRSWVGIGASVIQQVSIGNDVIIGAGSSVINDINSSTTVVGCPAKPL